MRYLRYVSWVLVGLGLLAIVAAPLFDLGEVVTLAGIMLILAGVVKIVVVYIWTNLAGLGTDRHKPVPPV